MYFSWNGSDSAASARVRGMTALPTATELAAQNERRVSNDGCRAILLRHVVNGCPDRDIRRVWEAEIAAVLMPRELDALLGTLSDILVVKQERGFTNRRSADVGHQRAENVFRQPRRLVVLFGNMIPLAAMADMNVIGSLSIHLLMHQVDQVIA